MSVDHGTPPTIPTALLPYDSYTIDPEWQLHFTAMWGAALAFAVLLAAPRALRLRNARLLSKNLFGVRVRGEYEPVPTREPDAPGDGQVPAKTTGSTVLTTGRLLDSLRLWSLPGLPLNLGQILVIAGYSVFALVCIVVQAPLMENPNRAGFLALAQLPPVFLFASKNSPLTGFLLGPGVDYTKLNYIHRWSARFLFLGAMVHGTLWINNHIVFDLPILSQQKEGSGVAALATLCVLVLTSFAPVRRWCYSLFLVVHFLTFPAFFVTICYHTIYAPPWIFPPIAFYAADVLVRIIRWRVVVGRVEAKEGGMSLIHVPLARTGWRAGQHVQMRALIGARAWEAHPLSICCAEPSVSCLTAPDGSPLGMLLAARACGDWSRSLWAYAKDAPDSDSAAADPDPDPDVDLEAGEGIKAEKRVVVGSNDLSRTDTDPDPGRDAHLLLEGPYGGPALRAGDFERVLLFAGGSGATFTLAVLDELVGRCVRLGRRSHLGETRTRRVVWCWCVRSFGAIHWFAPYLAQIAALAARPEAHLDLRIRIFVTCLCDPDAVPPIPGCTVTEARPSVGRVLERLLDDVARRGVDCCGELGPVRGRDGKAVDGDEKRASKNSSASASMVDLEVGEVDEDEDKSGAGGVAVFAAGPASLIREAGNAVASANLSARGRKAGGVSFNAEVFTI